MLSPLQNILTCCEAEGGHVFTVVTSAGGKGFTLATSGAGKATSAFGSVYTVATSAAGESTSNAALGMAPFTVGSSALVQITTIICSALIGVYITL